MRVSLVCACFMCVASVFVLVTPAYKCKITNMDGTRALESLVLLCLAGKYVLV